ncbi:hypothetical protein AX768_07060 [Burkholderia sp. PAMC 28687]|uniref:site-specific integrase n=1 Tax=Burkholderia sp. PAMC 28687 TaxID=1795874 RepID=UPI00078574BE|nr:site-specific integrase [Burkholderia sp. PAMC 28687]AMM13896.1 hypothetical protein AX768_07060 [Burkholderia sp. PAMC 28687]
MGTITTRTNADGTTSYKAQVRIRRGGTVIHQETQTFDRKQAATAWTKKRETDLAKPGALEETKAENPTLSNIIDRYLKEAQREIGKSKRNALLLIGRSTIGLRRGSDITSNTLVQWGVSLDLAPVTVSGYFSHLKTIYKIARPAWGYPLAKATIIEALDVLAELGITGTSDTRDRRPTLDELGKIIGWMRAKRMRNPALTPYDLIVLFAVFSSRRRGEIGRMRWSDIEPVGSRLLVFDMKDPKKKIGNHVWVDLTPEAVRIVRAVPRTDSELVFPVSLNAITTEFEDACDALGIEDLRFHDMRHEGVSRLFELGKSIPAVAMMSGHKSWTHLKRYAHIHAFGDKYANWEWMDICAPLPQLPLGYVKPQS